MTTSHAKEVEVVGESGAFLRTRAAAMLKRVRAVAILNKVLA